EHFKYEFGSLPTTPLERDARFNLRAHPKISEIIKEKKPMQLKEIMTTDVEVIKPESPITEAAKKMRSLDVGALPVCDGRRLLGMLTDRDITIRATAESRDPDETLVRDCMSRELVYCFEDQDIKEAERLMQDKQIRRLP